MLPNCKPNRIRTDMLSVCIMYHLYVSVTRHDNNRATVKTYMTKLQMHHVWQKHWHAAGVSAALDEASLSQSQSP